MKKDLANITEEEIKMICKFYNEPFLSYMTAKEAKSWRSRDLAISITTTCTINGGDNDSQIYIYYSGNVKLSRNNGNWGGMRDIDVNPLITIDYLRLKGYKFEYEIPEELQAEFKRLERKNKLNKLNNDEDI